MPHFDTILVMKDGELSERGSFKQLLERKGAFSDFLQAHFLQENEELTEQGLQIYTCISISGAHVALKGYDLFSRVIDVFE